MPISEEASGKKRLVVKKLFARQQHEGFGAVVRRSIGRFELRYFDPFLVLDEFSGEPSFFCLSLLASFKPNLSEIANRTSLKLAVSAPAGFPDHPHRGWFWFTAYSTRSFTRCVCVYMIFLFLFNILSIHEDIATIFHLRLTFIFLLLTNNFA